ncbi:hypothetical protein JTB14_001852 [Gonioctena quinquepunctata]|nr:hypothetical protein JTB14_001852 [Gonioctena quinquepunctata]
MRRHFSSRANPSESDIRSSIVISNAPKNEKSKHSAWARPIPVSPSSTPFGVSQRCSRHSVNIVFTAHSVITISTICR